MIHLKLNQSVLDLLARPHPPDAQFEEKTKSTIKLNFYGGCAMKSVRKRGNTKHKKSSIPTTVITVGHLEKSTIHLIPA